jgi:hypothetical protein
VTVGALLLLFGPRLERAIATRIEAEGAQRGLHARAGSVRVAPFSPLRLNDLTVEKPGLFQARVSSLSVTPRLVGCTSRRPAARVAVGQATLGLPAGLVIEAQPSVWDIRGLPPFTAELCEPTEGLTLTWAEPGQGRSLELQAARLRISLLARLLQDGAPVVDPELVDGDARLDLRPSGETSVDVRCLGPGPS